MLKVAECLSIVALSIATVLIVFVASAAIVAVVEGMGKDKISLHDAEDKQERKRKKQCNK